MLGLPAKVSPDKAQAPSSLHKQDSCLAACSNLPAPSSMLPHRVCCSPHTPPCPSRGHVRLGLPGHRKPVMPGRALEAARLEVKSCGEGARGCQFQRSCLVNRRRANNPSWLLSRSALGRRTCSHKGREGGCCGQLYPEVMGRTAG